MKCQNLIWCIKETSFATITKLSPSRVFKIFWHFTPASNLIPYWWLRIRKWKNETLYFKNVVKQCHYKYSILMSNDIYCSIDKIKCNLRIRIFIATIVSFHFLFLGRRTFFVYFCYRFVNKLWEFIAGIKVSQLVV